MVAHVSVMPQAMVNGGMDWVDAAIEIRGRMQAVHDEMLAISQKYAALDAAQEASQ